MEAPRIDPIAAAERVHAWFDLRRPHEIRIELIACALQAYVLYADAGAADARVVRSGERAYLTIAKAARGTPRARFSGAHEVGHLILHDDFDAIERIHLARTREGKEHRVENEANRFAAHVLVPTALALPMCAHAAPSLARVGELARAFDVSLSVAAMRWAEMATTGCAYVESRGDIIKRVVRSKGFRGEAVQRRVLEDGALAKAIVRGAERAGTRTHRGAWGSAKAGRDIVEECVPLVEDSAGTSRILTWLWHD